MAFGVDANPYSEHDFWLDSSAEQDDFDSDCAESVTHSVAETSSNDDRRDAPSSETAARTETDTGTVAVSSPAKKRRQTLLDLPLDVLEVILREVDNTNDLTSLALTCSTMHALAIPRLYSSFDIVWPEPQTDGNHSSAVDALSYGLTTLVMGPHYFNEVPMPSSGTNDLGCSNRPDLSVTRRLGRLHLGNNYAQYIKLFSIGNGPTPWVHEYCITRDTGKMLGTLVALAVARMVNLESFVWDMPTGLTQDVFISLASLSNRPGHECRLERVWVRWHDNSKNPRKRLAIQGFKNGTLNRSRHQGVEYPTFSVLPPLKSLTVLNIDEPSYLEEMAVLIHRSRHKLTELRIGLSEMYGSVDWHLPAGQNTPEHPSGWPRPGGVLSILLNDDDRDVFLPKFSSGNLAAFGKIDADDAPLSTTVQMLSELSVDETQHGGSRKKPEKLKLEALELESVHISAAPLMLALDWRRLTKLTLLRCFDTESLWRALRRQFSPPTDLQGRKKATNVHYALNLKHLHTDHVSPYLMLFLKEAIAPNTLEDVFLLSRSGYELSVGINAIYKYILRPHHASLRKVLVDCTTRVGRDVITTPRRQWMLPRSVLGFLTSGKMSQLRELGMIIDGRDWHYFLQRLPNLPNLRALYLADICDRGGPSAKRGHERALQVLTAITLRPEIQLCYLGIWNKCFEIVEVNGSSGRDGRDVDDNDVQSIANSDLDSVDYHDDEDDDEDDMDDPIDSVSEHDDEDDSFSVDDEPLSDEDDAHDVDAGTSKAFRLREILFYDQNVSIFGARHCRL